MGSGKSTIGRACASTLGWTFVDIDAEIVNQTGMTIPNIFESYGETYFRDIESTTCLRVLNRKAVVVALGGGTLGSQLVRTRVFKSPNLTVWLRISPDEASRRLATDTARPLWQSGGIDRWRELADARRPLYEQCQLHVDTDGRTVESICQEVCDAVVR